MLSFILWNPVWPNWCSPAHNHYRLALRYQPSISLPVCGVDLTSFSFFFPHHCSRYPQVPSCSPEGGHKKGCQGLHTHSTGQRPLLNLCKPKDSISATFAFSNSKILSHDTVKIEMLLHYNECGLGFQLEF